MPLGLHCTGDATSEETSSSRYWHPEWTLTTCSLNISTFILSSLICRCTKINFSWRLFQRQLLPTSLLCRLARRRPFLPSLLPVELVGAEVWSGRSVLHLPLLLHLRRLIKMFTWTPRRQKSQSLNRDLMKKFRFKAKMKNNSNLVFCVKLFSENYCQMKNKPFL